ncbi:hypothetical protein ACFOFO_17685 [Undibacterium arcticum]|uniref:Uncharacterized protein n=1 Tax=Undibacterium arcticum TaxID=1762892 RepID=A0ABV7F7L3_9BURK
MQYKRSFRDLVEMMEERGLAMRHATFMQRQRPQFEKHHGMGEGLALPIAMPVVRNERKFYGSREEMLSIAKRCEARHVRTLIRIALFALLVSLLLCATCVG